MCIGQCRIESCAAGRRGEGRKIELHLLANDQNCECCIDESRTRRPLLGHCIEMFFLSLCYIGSVCYLLHIWQGGKSHRFLWRHNSMHLGWKISEFFAADFLERLFFQTGKYLKYAIKLYNLQWKESRVCRVVVCREIAKYMLCSNSSVSSCNLTMYASSWACRVDIKHNLLLAWHNN